MSRIPRVWITDSRGGLGGAQRGDEVVALNGEPMTAWLPRLTRHISADNDALAQAILARMFRAYLWLEIPDATVYVLELRRASGDTVEIELPALTADRLEKRPSDRAEAQFSPLDRRASILRGGSARPLYVTATERVAELADRVRTMHGAHRIPTLLAEVDRLARQSP